MNNASAQKLLEEKLNEVKKNFISSLGGRVEAIVNAKNDLVQNGYSPKQLALLHGLVHNLAGTSAAFQLKEISEACSDVDIYLRPYVKENKEFSNEYMPEIISKVNIIEKSVIGLNE